MSRLQLVDLAGSEKNSLTGTTGLTANILAKQHAREQAAEEARMEAQFKKQEAMMKKMGGGAEMGKAMFDMARQQIRSKRACLESQAKGVLSEQMVDLMYETLDKDKNGSVSKEEFLAGAVSSLMAEQLAARQMAQVGESMGEECKQM